MPRRSDLPPGASVAQTGADARLHAPSAARNAAVIVETLTPRAPAEGRALEIASGTGEHAVALAAAMPGMEWQPSEIDAARRASIDAHAAAAGLPNLLPAIALDATARAWGTRHAGQDLILTVNLLHLISHAEAEILLEEARATLAPGGLLALYGPFLRGGVATSEGDSRFHASLRDSDPHIGYKDLEEVKGWLRASGLGTPEIVQMPANNLFFFARLSL